MKNKDLIFWLFLITTVLAGLFFRLKGLGKWPLAVDEYYIIKSAENILQYGLPKWDVGGYYTRGLPLQYLTALLLICGVKAEFAGRIFPVIANLAAVPALYMLAKKISGKVLGAAVIFVFIFSVWEIEFARFARMYTLFQTIFIWYLYFLYETIIEKDESAFKWLWLLSFFSIFVYEASIFLVLLNFISIFWDNSKDTLNPFYLQTFKGKILKILSCIGLLFIAYGFLTFDFRTLYQNDFLPPEVVNYFSEVNSGGMLRQPVLLIQTFIQSNVWLLLFLIPIGVSSVFFYRIVKSDSTIFTKVSFSILIMFSFLNLLGLTVISFLFFVLIGWLKPEDIKLFSSQEPQAGERETFSLKIVRDFLMVGVINFIFWIVFALSTDAWYKLFPKEKISTAGFALKTIVKESINYPYLYETYALFRDTIPIATFITILLLSFFTIFVLINYHKKEVLKYRFALFILLVLILAQNIINLVYFETRYFFFLYPLILLLALLSLETISKLLTKRRTLTKLVFGLSLTMLLIFSEDFQVNHILNIDSKEINFRMKSNFSSAVHYYPRWDSETPSNIVNIESVADDIIITNEQTCEFYLNRLNYIFRDYRWAEFPGESVFKGTKERWTNANLIYKYSVLNQTIDNSSHNIWLLINTTWALDELKLLVNTYNKYLYYKSIDGHILLYKIP